MEGHFAGTIAAIGIIILATQVVHRIGYKLLMLGGPACWLVTGLMLGPYLPSLVDATLFDAPGADVEHTELGLSTALGLLAAFGAFGWLLSSSLGAYLLGPEHPLREDADARERLRTWWHEVMMVVPSAVLRFGLMLWALSWTVPEGRSVGLIHVFLALILTPGSARQVIKLDYTFMLTAVQLRGAPPRRTAPPPKTKDKDGPRVPPYPMTRRERAHLSAVRESLAQVRTGWLVLIAPLLLLVEYNLAIGQTQLTELQRPIGRLAPHLLLLIVASGAWFYARKRTAAGRPLHEQHLDRFEALSESMIPFYVAVPLGLSASLLLFVLDPTPLLHTWWFVPLALGPIIAALLADSQRRHGLAAGLQALVGFTAPCFFYLLGAEVGELLSPLPWSRAVFITVMLLVHPAFAAPLVSAVDRLGERTMEALRARARGIPVDSDRLADRAQRHLARLLGAPSRALADAVPGADSESVGHPPQSEAPERTRFGARPAAYLREALSVNVSDIALVIVGMAFFEGLVSVEIAGLVALVYVVGELIGTWLFGAGYFSVGYEQIGPHELAVIRANDLEPTTDA